MTTESGNKIIAEFMGGKLKSDNTSNEPYYLMPNKQKLIPELLIYHLSWDCLMPVVEKIFGISSANGAYSNQNKILDAISACGINKVWLAVIEFINWYNSQQTQP